MSQHEPAPTEAEQAVLDLFGRIMDSVRVARMVGDKNATTSTDDLVNVTTFAIWATKTMGDLNKLAIAIRGTEYSAIGAEIMRLLVRDDPFEDVEKGL